MKGLFVCPDGCGLNFDQHFFEKLKVIDQHLRLLGHPEIHITSGPRCDAWNAKIGGANNSAHRLSVAADIEFSTSRHLAYLVMIAIEMNVLRIGLHPSKHFIHIDCAPGIAGIPSPAIWFY